MSKTFYCTVALCTSVAITGSVYYFNNGRENISYDTTLYKKKGDKVLLSYAEGPCQRYLSKVVLRPEEHGYVEGKKLKHFVSGGVKHVPLAIGQEYETPEYFPKNFSLWRVNSVGLRLFAHSNIDGKSYNATGSKLNKQTGEFNFDVNKIDINGPGGISPNRHYPIIMRSPNAIFARDRHKEDHNDPDLIEHEKINFNNQYLVIVDSEGNLMRVDVDGLIKKQGNKYVFDKEKRTYKSLEGNTLLDYTECREYEGGFEIYTESQTSQIKLPTGCSFVKIDFVDDIDIDAILWFDRSNKYKTDYCIVSE